MSLRHEVEAHLLLASCWNLYRSSGAQTPGFELDPLKVLQECESNP